MTFTVDAYPNDLFQGKIFQVRLNFTTTQNVVTYPVVVEAANAELKLLPGMTASLSFQIDQHNNVLRVPNAALRFYPQARAGAARRTARCWKATTSRRPKRQDGPGPGPVHAATDVQRSAGERAEAGRNRNRRHVWVVDGDFLKAVEDRHRPERQQVLGDRLRFVGGWAERGHGRLAARRSHEAVPLTATAREIISRELALNAPRRPAGAAKEQDAGRPDGAGRGDRHRRRHRDGLDRPERQRPGARANCKASAPT